MYDCTECGAWYAVNDGIFVVVYVTRPCTSCLSHHQDAICDRGLPFSQAYYGCVGANYEDLWEQYFFLQKALSNNGSQISEETGDVLIG
jgi:hypothetical protein